MAHLSLSLFGAFQATCDGHPVASFESIKVRALLAYLMVEADRPHRREALSGLLWPDLPDETARTNLRQALANLRLILGDRSADPPFILATRESIQFNPTSAHWLDVVAFARLLAACDQHPHRQPDTCKSCAKCREQAVVLYGGSFLDQFFLADSAAFEEWAALKREHFHQQALGALGHLAVYHERRGRYEEAQHYVRRQLELDAWREEAHLQLMRLLWLSGQRSAALAQYATCRRILHEELGVAPTAEMTALHERIQHGQEQVPPRIVSPNNLAAHTFLTPFIGRHDELAQIMERLDHRDCRLLTLVGPGGAGKTRLALEAATEQIGSFRDGVYFVPLAPLSTPEQLVNAIVTTLGLTLGGSEPPKVQLLAYLREKEMLLVLDNFEHLVAGVDDLLAILRSAPMVKLLVTSREPLNLRAEWLVDIEGMSFPRNATAQDIEAYSAVQLFVQTAQQVKPVFSLSSALVPSVARICELVEGLPLAIELAAAWVRTQSCDHIAQEIERSLDYLATAMRDVPERQRSMRAVFDYSWKLLSLDEQRLLRQASVFRGGFLLEAAEQVASAAQSLLSMLVGKSLLRRDANGRYDMHELVRQYAAEQLHEAGERGLTQDRHLVYFLKLVEQADAELVGPQRRVWLERMNAENNNIRAALEWCKTRGYRELWLRLAAMLWLYWEASGRLQEGIDWLGAALEQTGDQHGAMEAPVVPDQRTTKRIHGAASARAHALIGAAQLGRHHGDLIRATAWAEESLTLCREQEDSWGVAASLNILGRVVRDRGNLLWAERLLEESVQMYRAINDAGSIAYALMPLAVVVERLGELGRAVEMNEESLSLFRTLRDGRGIAFALMLLGGLALSLDDHARALKLLNESLELFREQQVKPSAANVLRSLGVLERNQGNYPAARLRFEESLALQREMGNRQSIVELLDLLETTATEQGDDPAAEAFRRERLALGDEVNHGLTTASR